MVKSCYLIGDPVKQSPSPHIMNTAFRDKGYSYNYELFPIAPEDLKEKMRFLRSPNVLFFNVTVPHKIEICKYLDDLESEAQDIGAASCVLSEAGKLIGFNTDLFGFSTALNKHNLSLSGESVDVLGAGGASGAVVYDLTRKGANVRVLNRTLDKAKDLARKFNCHYGTLENSGDSERKLVVNTTKVGMFPNVVESIISQEQVRAYENVADIVYNPKETKLLALAKESGVRALDGLGLDMLISLLARSFEIGTGSKPNVGLMYKIARQRLGIS